MAQARSHHMCDGEVVVYDRPGSKTSNWYFRIKLKQANKWKKFSAKTDDLEEAKRAALRQYDLVRALEGQNVYVDGKRFSQVAELTIHELEEELHTGSGKPTYIDYIRVIGLYKGAFGNKYIQNIRYQDLVEYHRERWKVLGRKLKRSTINLHNTALMRVFETAVQRGWMSKAQIVTYKNDGVKTEPRSYFEAEEYEKLRKFMSTYASTNYSNGHGANKQRSRWIRELLPDLVHFLVCTGIRFGTESRSIKWKHITELESKGERFIRIKLDKGKTGPRVVIANHDVRGTLENIKSRFPHLASRTLGEMTDVDEHVFRIPDGTQPKDWHGAFQLLLERAELLRDSKGQKRSLYSLRHTYATFMLEQQKIDLHTLAKNMGTSVAMLEQHYSHLQVVRLAKQLATGEIGNGQSALLPLNGAGVLEIDQQGPYAFLPVSGKLDLSMFKAR